MTMLERVARAICLASYGEARAALKAMLEPTEAVMAALDARCHETCGDPLEQGDERPGEGWTPAFIRAFIQSALDGK